MKNLTRKLFISLFAAVFALITLGATTFAWFTLTTTVAVEQFEAEITSGTGIEVSLDGVTFTNLITNEKIVEKIKNINFGGSSIVLDPVTTANGYSEFKILDISNPGEPKLQNATENDKWIIFFLYFRTPYREANQDTWVYMLDDTTITSDPVTWISDADFIHTSDVQIQPGTPKQIFACNSLRMSFQTFTMTTEQVGKKDLFKKTDVGDDTVVIYELDPDIEPADENDGNNRLDKEIKSYGMVSYFRAKTGGDDDGIDLLEYLDDNDVVLPDGVLKSANLVNKAHLEDDDMTDKAAIVKLTTVDDDENPRYYYGVVKVQMWIEGWDPDCYNAIMAGTLKVKLSFGGSSKKPGIPVEAED